LSKAEWTFLHSKVQFKAWRPHMATLPTPSAAAAAVLNRLRETSARPGCPVSLTNVLNMLLNIKPFSSTDARGAIAVLLEQGYLSQTATANNYCLTPAGYAAL
jgi:hypothetical protein